MKHSFWNKRIPTIVGILFVSIAVVITSLLVQQNSSLLSLASSVYAPQGVRVTDVTDTSFIITYWTDNPTTASVAYGEEAGKLNSVVQEQAGNTNVAKTSVIHSLLVTDLKPNTKYYFSILSQGATFLQNGKPFEIATGPPLEGNSGEEKKLEGKILFPDNAKNHSALVYLSQEGMQVLSVESKEDGTFTFPLQKVRSSDLSSFFSYTDGNFDILVVSPDGKSQVTLENTASSIPPILLSKDYNFLLNTPPVDNDSSSSAVLESFPEFDEITEIPRNPNILSPERQEEFSDQQPLFKGVGVPNASVEITIHSEEEIAAKTAVNNKGIWTYRPTTPLSPGEHTITIKSRNSSGIIQTIMRSFTVYAEGSQFVEPSISPTKAPTTTVTPQPSPSPTRVPTATPTPLQQPIPTATPSIVVPTVFIPTATPIVFVSQPPVAPPVSGDNTSLIIGGVMGILLASAGVLFFLF